ncbi:MAG: hypothetical protein WDO14_19060 [Bacteroidota bacterium]
MILCKPEDNAIKKQQNDGIYRKINQEIPGIKAGDKSAGNLYHQEAKKCQRD